MPNVNYTLHTDADDILHEEIAETSHVPRVGELVSVDYARSFEVIDVLWHVNTADGTQDTITVTACERDWHQHIKDRLRDHGPLEH